MAWLYLCVCWGVVTLGSAKYLVHAIFNLNPKYDKHEKNNLNANAYRVNIYDFL